MPGFALGVYAYDPAANSWSEESLAMPKEIGKCPSGFYNPDLAAHFVMLGHPFGLPNGRLKRLGAHF